MKSGGINSIGPSDLTKVPKGFTDPNKVADSKDGKPAESASRALSVINPDALQATVQGAMKELPASETPYLLGYPMPEITLGETQGMNGSGAVGAAPAKGAGGTKMTMGDSSAAKKKVAAALAKKGLDLDDVGLDADDIPDDVMKLLAAKDINLQRAYDLTVEANEEDAEDEVVKADANNVDAKAAVKTPGAKAGAVEKPLVKG